MDTRANRARARAAGERSLSPPPKQEEAIPDVKQEVKQPPAGIGSPPSLQEVADTRIDRLERVMQKLVEELGTLRKALKDEKQIAPNETQQETRAHALPDEARSQGPQVPVHEKEEFSHAQGRKEAPLVYGKLSSAGRLATPSSGPHVTHNLPPEGAYGVIVGRQDHYKGKLENVSDLHAVIKHLRDFATHQRTHGDHTQAFATTMSAKAMMDLRLEDTRVDTWSILEWKNTLSSHLRKHRAWLEDSMAALEKVPLEGYTKSTRDLREYHTTNCLAVLRYLNTLEAYRQECENLTGVELQAAKPEPATVQSGPSTVYEIFTNKMTQAIEDFIPVCTEGIRFRQISTWNVQYTMLCDNISKAQVTFHSHRRMFNTYDTIARGQPKRDERQAKADAYTAAKARIYGAQGNQKQLFPVPPSKGTWQQKNTYTPNPHSATINALGDEDEDEEFLTPKEAASPTSDVNEIGDEDEEEEHIQETIAQMMDATSGSTRPKSSACFHNLIGTCTKGKECLHSHDQADAAELIKLVTANFRNKRWGKEAAVNHISALVSEKLEGNACRIRIHINGHEAIALIDTGNELPTVMAQRFAELHGIKTHAITPVMADLAGTGVKRELTEGASIEIGVTTPISRTKSTVKLRACIFPTNRDDIIIGIKDVVRHFIPLTVELLLTAFGKDLWPPTMVAALASLAGDVFGISAMAPAGNDSKRRRVEVDLAQEEELDPSEELGPTDMPALAPVETDSDEDMPELVNLDTWNAPNLPPSRNPLTDPYQEIVFSSERWTGRHYDFDGTEILPAIGDEPAWNTYLLNTDPGLLRGAIRLRHQERTAQRERIYQGYMNYIRRHGLELSQEYLERISSRAELPLQNNEATINAMREDQADPDEDNEPPPLVHVAQRFFSGSTGASPNGTINAMREDQDDSEGDEPPPLAPLSQRPSNAPTFNGGVRASPVEGQRYEPLERYEAAPEEEGIPQSTLFGHAEAEALDLKYNTEEAYAERVKSYLTDVPDAIKEGMGEKSEELREFLCKADGDAMKSHTHRHWHGLRIEPIEIEFLSTLPESIFTRARPTQPHLLKQITELVTTLANQGYLEYNIQGSYASPTTYVPKPNGGLRMCNDLRKINAYIKYSPVPQPNIHAGIAMLRGFSLFTEMDWATAYHQIPISVLTQERLAMSTPLGIYRPRFLPEGVKVGSALMMGVVYAIFAKYTEWIIPIHDNLLIAAHNPEDMLKKIKIIYAECARVGVQLNIRKCQFGVTRLKFFGYIVEPGEYYADKERIEDILKIPFPTTRKKVQRYLGMAVFISPFIVNFVGEFEKIYQMSTEGFSFRKESWGDTDYEQEFEKSKRHLKDAASIYFPDRELEWILRTDASNTAIGGVLIQMMPVDRLTKEQLEQATKEQLITTSGTVAMPIAFISKKLSDPATRWTVTEQELFAIVHSLKKLEYIIGDKRIVVETDHLNLVALSEGAIATSARCTRWRQYLAQFDYVIQHIAGAKNITADYLSRHIFEPEETTSTSQAIAYIMSSIYEQLTPEHHIEATINALQEVPSKSAHDMISEVHNDRTGHRGAKSTWQQVKRLYPNAPITFAAVASFVQDCGACAKLRDPFQDPMTSLRALPVRHARAVTNVDVTTITKDRHGMLYLFVFINTFTKYTLIYPSKDKEARSVAMAMLQHAAVVGLTDCMWSDNGPEFTAAVTQELATIMGATWTYTLAYRPQANGIVERQNKEIIDRIRMLLLFKDTWQTWSSPAVISLVQLSINTTEHGTTGYTPCTLMFGETARQYIRSPNALRRAENADLMDFNTALDNVQEAARLNIVASQLPRLQQQPEIAVTYQPGDLVLRNPRRDTGAVGMRKNKLEPTNLGPYEVIRQEPSVDGMSNTVVVREVNDRDKTQEFHGSTLRIFPGTLQEAQELAKIDNLEFAITRVICLNGNTANRDELEVQVELEDGTIETMPYLQAIHTAAFSEYCEKVTIGKLLCMTRAELQTYTSEQSPKQDESVAGRMLTWKPEDRIQLQDRRYITAHIFNTKDWHIYDDPETIPREARNREPMLEAIVVKITKKAIDLEIPGLSKHAGARLKRYIVALSLPKILLYTARETEVREQAMILTTQLIHKSKLREQLHLATGF